MKILILCIFPLTLFSQNNPFIIGENLIYKASFANLPAAVASLEIIKKDTINNSITYHTRFHAKTIGISNFLFPINDRIDLWLDEDSLLPHKVESKIEEGSFKKNTNTILYQNLGYAIVNQDTIKLKHKTHSPYSLFYFLRNQNLNKIKNKIINTIQGNKLSSLKLHIEQNVTESVPAGNFNCIKVSPFLADNKEFKNQAKMSILFSDDINQYPVKIWLNLKFGSLVLELDKIIN